MRSQPAPDPAVEHRPDEDGFWAAVHRAPASGAGGGAGLGFASGDGRHGHSGSEPSAELSFPTSEMVLERGLWRTHAGAAPRDSRGSPRGSRPRSRGGAATLPAPDPLEWEPIVPLRERIVRAVSVPAVAGGIVFVGAIVVAIVLTMLQIHPARPLSEGSGDAGVASAESRAAGAEEAGDADGTSASNGSRAADGSPDLIDPGPAGLVTVHVVGEVVTPGVVRVPSGTRVEAAITAAGGPTDAAVLEAVNLARVVVDGEQVLVPDAEAVAAGDTGAGSPTGAASGTPSAGASGSTAAVHLNTADLGALDTLPGIGPALAQRIIDWRETNGPFTSVDQLLDVPGVGEKILAGLRARVQL